MERSEPAMVATSRAEVCRSFGRNRNVAGPATGYGSSSAHVIGLAQGC